MLSSSVSFGPRLGANTFLEGLEWYNIHFKVEIVRRISRDCDLNAELSRILFRKPESGDSDFDLSDDFEFFFKSSCSFQVAAGGEIG